VAKSESILSGAVTCPADLRLHPSSTENSSNNAWIQRFSDGNQNNNNKNNSNWVAPVRRLSGVAHA